MNGIIKQRPNYRIDRYIQFGIYKLNHFQLNNNILLLKTSKSFNPTPFKRTIISDNLKALIFDILHTNDINIDLQKQLSLDDTLLFEKLLKTCKIIDELNYVRQTNNLDDLINRFQVLRGGLISGNQSIELKTELINTINILINFNKIDLIIGNELIDILK